MNPKEDLCGSLIKWLQTFELHAPHRTAEDISDGVAMAQALNQIAPDWFSDLFLSKIKENVGNNWRLKVSNLRKVVDSMADYYHECLNIADFKKPDSTLIGEQCDRFELGRMLQFILGCAVNCAHKEDYIARIMGMEKVVQEMIMQAIQELDREMSLGPTSDDGTVTKLMSDLEKAVEERDQMGQRCHELDHQVSLLQDERQSILQENKKLLDRLHELENPQDTTVIGGSKFNKLKRDYDNLKKEMLTLETSLDDSRMRVEVQENEIKSLQSKLDEVQIQADESRELKDELDILRETADKVAKYELQLDSYKRKLEELSDLKRQLKILEEKNTSYMEQIIDLEEETKKITPLKSQVEIYKKQLTELHQRVSDETMRADRFEFECKKSQEKLSTVEREKERLMEERDVLREANEELRCSQLPDTMRHAGPDTPPKETGVEHMLPPEVKEKISRLSRENKMLREKQQEAGSEQTQDMLDDAKLQINKLSSENRLLNQKILEIQSQLTDVLASKTSGASDDTDTVNIRKELLLIQSQVKSLKGENEKYKQKIEQQDELFEQTNRKCVTLKETLTRKEAEVQQLEERYKKNMEKAKSVITSFDLTTLRSQLEKEHLSVLQRMEKDHERKKLDYENELKLMTSAFHRLGSQRQRDSTDQRLATLSSGQSFLARQRQPTNRRQPIK